MTKQAEMFPVEQKENMAERAAAIKEHGAAMAETMSDLGIDAKDLVIPSLMLMQNTSEAVGDGKAKLGDILNSQTNEIVGDLTKAVEIIPLKMYKTLRIYDVSGSNPKLRRVEPLTAQNEKLHFEGNEEGTPVKRYLTMNFWVLLSSDVAKGEDFPHEIRFKSTGLQAGKKLATAIFKLAATGKLPYARSVKLGSTKQKKETNTFAVFDIQAGNPTSNEEKSGCEKWLGILSSVTYRVDDQEEADVSTAETKEPHVVKSSVVSSPGDLY